MIKLITSSTNQSELDLKTKKVQTITLFRMLLLFGFIFSTQFVIAQPTITSFAPTSGKVGDTITINGTNFNATAANNVIFFGATRATVIAAKATNLTVTVPIGATFAPITVLNSATGLSAYSTQFFNSIFSPNKGSFTPNDLAEKTDFATGPEPYLVAIGDIDGDGKPDLAIANYGGGSGNTVSVLRNTSSIDSVSFATKVDFTTGSDPMSVAIGDIDGDGKPDLAIANSASNSVSVLRNTSSIGIVNFATKLDFTTGIAPVSLSIGDIDGNGKPDLAVVNYSSNVVSVYRNTSNSGNVSFASKVNFTTGSGPKSVVIGDLDGDKKPDLAVANAKENTISIFRNTGNGGTIIFDPKVDLGASNGPSTIAIGDLDGDSKSDMAISNDGGTVSIFRNTGSIGNISFATYLDYTTGTSYSYDLAIGDLDGDGKPDLAIANFINYNFSVMRNISSRGTISFANKIDFTTGDYPKSIAIGDLDGDGKPDLAISIAGDRIVSIFRNNPQPNPPSIISFTPKSGEVGSKITLLGKGFNTIPTNNIVFIGATKALVSLATDTSLSIIAPTGATYGLITVLNKITNLAAYSSQFFNPIFSPNKSSITSADIATKVDFKTDTIPSSIAIGDIDGDGKPDIVIVNNKTNSISVLRNTGSAGNVSFAKKVDFVVGSIPESVAISDLDGDGKLDLAVTNSNERTVSILRNIGKSDSINFATKLDFTTGSYPSSIAIADLDGDGRPDLAITNIGSNDVSILRNTSRGEIISFDVNFGCLTGKKPTSVAIGDLDGDGKLDLAVANAEFSGSVSVLRNKSSIGTFNFDVKVDFVAGSGSQSIVIGDLDGDNKPDLAIANNYSNNVSVLRNMCSIGTINYANKLDFPTNIYPWSIAIGDINGDKKLDLATAHIGANSSINTVSVLGNTSNIGNVNFATMLFLGTGSDPRSIAIGDLNGDGKPDLAVANSSSNSASVLRNLSPTIGINELKLNNQVLIYPNPFNETIFISLLNNSGLNKAILYDLLGKDVLTTHKSEIDVKDLKSGVYLIMVIDNNGGIYSQKLIKN